MGIFSKDNNCCETLSKVSELHLEDSEYNSKRQNGFESENTLKTSPPFYRMKTSEQSPLAETVVISEDYQHAGTLVTDNMSDLSNTPSIWNGKD